MSRYQPFNRQGRAASGGNSRFRGRGLSRPAPRPYSSTQKDDHLRALEQEDYTTKSWLHTIHSRRSAAHLNLFQKLGFESATFPEDSGKELHEALDQLEQRHLSKLFFALDSVMQDWRALLRDNMKSRRQELRTKPNGEEPRPERDDLQPHILLLLDEVRQTLKHNLPPPK